MRSRTALFALLAAIVALIAVLAWMLTTAEAKPVELAAEPEIHRLPLQGRRELVAPDPDSVAVETAAKVTAEPEEEARRTRALDPRSPPRPGPPVSAGSGPTVVTLGGGVVLYGHLLVRQEPLAGACIEVAPEDEDEPTFRAVVETDSQGRYEVRLPRGGSYAFTVTHEERELHGRRVLGIPDVRSHRRDLEFGLGTITGTVTTMRIGKKRLEKPFELSGVEVLLAASPDGPRAVSTTSTYRQGRFEFTVLTPATYAVRSMGSRRQGGLTIGQGYAESSVLHLEQDGDHREAELALRAGCTAKGTVLCSHSPRHSPHVVGVQYLGEPLRHAAFAFTDAQGSFEIEGLAPGTVRLGEFDWGVRAGSIQLTFDEPATIELTCGSPPALVKLFTDGVDWKAVRLHDALEFPVPILPFQQESFSTFRLDAGSPPQALANYLQPGDYTVRAKRGCTELEHPIRVTEEREQEFRIDF